MVVRTSSFTSCTRTPLPLSQARRWPSGEKLTASEEQCPSSSFALLPVTLVFVFSFFTKNVRYLVVLELPIRIFAVLMIERAFGLQQFGIPFGHVLA